jgi:NAD-dependent dihydropyrimidine dehydrogenase PreA subunit
MCQFCVEHGDGKAWYLEAATYAHDLESDLERRAYVLDFIRDFGESREWALKNVARLERLPAPLRGLGSAAASKRMQRSHFGQPVPIEEIEAILDITTSVVRVPCVCRHESGAADKGYCLMISTKPYDALLDEAFADYDAGPDVSKFQHLDRTETLALLRRCEDEGLMHSVWTFITPFVGAICNCDLESGCMAMTMTVGHDVPVMFKGHSVAVADHDSCNGCRACVKRCPFGAIEVDRATKRATVDPEGCFGCGVCRSGCRESALRLVDREAEVVA